MFFGEEKIVNRQKQVGEQQQQAGEEEGEEGAKYQPQVPSSSIFLRDIAFSLSYQMDIAKYEPQMKVFLFLTFEKPIHPGCAPARGAARGGGDETSETDGEHLMYLSTLYLRT